MRSLQLKSLLVLVALIGLGGGMFGQASPMWETLDPNSDRPRMDDGMLVHVDPRTGGDPVYLSNGEVRLRTQDLGVSSVGFGFLWVS